MTLRWRIALLLGAVALGVGAFAAAASYVSTSSQLRGGIDDTLKAVEQLGGSTVVGKTPVGAMGFTAYVKDPEGNVIGLWETAAQG